MIVNPPTHSDLHNNKTCTRLKIFIFNVTLRTVLPAHILISTRNPSNLANLPFFSFSHCTPEPLEVFKPSFHPDSSSDSSANSQKPTLNKTLRSNAPITMSDSPIPNANAASLSTPATSAMSSNASSRRSSISSSATPGIRPIPAAAGASASTAASASTRRLQQTADPLSRDYPKPEGEIDVAEALSREPPKWTLGYWSKNAPELRTPPLSPKTSQKRLEDTKRELRQAHNDMATKMSKR